MNEGSVDRAVAIVGVAAIMPDAPDAAAFWQNIKDGRYSISDVTADRWDPALYYDPDPRHPTRPIRRSGAGCATSNGIRSAGSSRSHPESATQWTTPRNGP